MTTASARRTGSFQGGRPRADHRRPSHCHAFASMSKIHTLPGDVPDTTRGWRRPGGSATDCQARPSQRRIGPLRLFSPGLPTAQASSCPVAATLSITAPAPAVLVSVQVPPDRDGTTSGRVTAAGVPAVEAGESRASTPPPEHPIAAAPSAPITASRGEALTVG
ncbi:hypothetical protein ACIBK1_24655 [Microbispora rosea]|uniref:hypothetical protein n=1 Tax=Microbispora rosea TaxID=58117 RepID=UPI00379621F7